MRSLPQLDRTVEENERAKALDPTAQCTGLVHVAADAVSIGLQFASWQARRRGRPTRRTLGDVPVFVLRRGRQVDVLYDLCSHLSGPLSEGELSGAGDAMCITCPWHGSTFRLRDGQVQRGPTTYPQPVLQVRVDPDGCVQARLREDD